jgi:hypothetical protein
MNTKKSTQHRSKRLSTLNVRSDTEHSGTGTFESADISILG